MAKLLQQGTGLQGTGPKEARANGKPRLHTQDEIALTVTKSKKQEKTGLQGARLQAAWANRKPRLQTQDEKALNMTKSKKTVRSNQASTKVPAHTLLS